MSPPNDCRRSSPTVERRGDVGAAEAFPREPLRGDGCGGEPDGEPGAASAPRGVPAGETRLPGGTG